MIKRILIPSFIFCILGFMSGCSEEQLAPEIVGVVPSLRNTTTLSEIKPKPPTAKATKINAGRAYVPSGWMPPSSVEKRWKAIVIHHSATDKGSADIFDKQHRDGNGWEGVGYDFVIGNGSASYDGQVEVTFRWQKQKVGAHCKTDHTNWANRDAIGICLVGNFNNTSPRSKQISSLVKLVSFLSKRYNIPKSRIYGHNTTPRHRTVTDCPGKRFDMNKFKSLL